MTIQKATIAQVKIGSGISIEGLRLPDGSFAIAVPQAAELFSVPQNNYQRDLKPALGKDFQFVKATSELNSKKVNILTLPQFEKVLTYLDRKGNKKAQDLRDALTGMALDTLFCDAFGLVSDARTRQAALDARFAGIEQRRFFTDSIKDQYLANHPEVDAAPSYAYSNPSDLINLLLTGQKAAYWRDRFGLKTNAELRSHWSLLQLKRIERIEEMAVINTDTKNMEPCEAVRSAVEYMQYEVWDEDRLLGKGDQKEYARQLMRRRRAAVKAA